MDASIFNLNMDILSLIKNVYILCVKIYKSRGKVKKFVGSMAQGIRGCRCMKTCCGGKPED
jgi:hypothetical protein